MDSRPVLESLTRILHEVGLEAILIGNAAAALQAAPVTTIDFDFLFRKTPRNMQKLKALARALKGVILRPYYPSSDLFRLVRDDDGLQVDFMTAIHGVKSFSGLRARSHAVVFGGHTLWVADLEDVLRSKRAAGRPRDKAVLDILEKALDERSRQEKGKARRPEGGK
jgi:predicted nucleotidyltransferase